MEVIDNNLSISVKNLTKVYPLYNSPHDRIKEALHPRRKKYHKDFYALKDVTFEIKKGEVIGIVGKNGSGKSTLLKILSRVLTPSSGEFVVNGSVSSLLELGSGFNPELTGIENVFFYGTILGFPEAKLKAKLDEIIDFADIGDFINQPLRTYSSGMRARLAFSVAINVDPDILILDEILSVGDELFRRKCYARMEQFFKDGRTVLYVSHSIQSVNELCTRAIMLDHGEQILEGPTKLVTMCYQKLLFSKKESQGEIREEMDKLKKNWGNDWEKQVNEHNPGLVQAPEPDNANPHVYCLPKPDTHHGDNMEGLLEAYYVEGFSPKSTVVTKNRPMEMSDIQIKTPEGVIVNHLVVNQEYVYEFIVKTREHLDNLSIGWGISDEKGAPISWTFLEEANSAEATIQRQAILVRTRFVCRLLKGVYFCTNTIRLKKTNELAIKIRDGYVFKVIGDHRNKGLVTLDQDTKVKIV